MKGPPVSCRSRVFSHHPIDGECRLDAPAPSADRRPPRGVFRECDDGASQPVWVARGNERAAGLERQHLRRPDGRGHDRTAAAIASRIVIETPSLIELLT
jgi:hypothetical protein